MGPAHQCLDLGHGPAAELHDRLVDEAQLLGQHGPTEVALERQSLAGIVLECRVEQDVPAFAAGFRPVHRQVGLLQHLPGGRCFAVAQRDPDARGGLQLRTRKLGPLRDVDDQPLGEADRRRVR